MSQSKVYVVEQNLGMCDRIIRFCIGSVMLALPYYYITHGQSMEPLYAWSMLLSIYPFLTSIAGCDITYKLFNVKSCDLSQRNRCGSFPFEVDAFLGHKPIAEDDTEHTLDHSSHKLKHT